jgi:putative ABC transport system permease protein
MRSILVRLGSYVLDVKLALRMLVRYPLLTIVGSIGMAFGIAAGVGGFEIRSQFVDPTLPLDEGRRIVGLRNWDVRNDRPAPLSEPDFRAWREQLQRIHDLGGVALVERNLTVDGNTEPIGVAEMTASGFRTARVPPVFGRTLVDDDELPGAPPVAVIGHSLWQRRFLGDPRIVGRSVRLGTEQTTIVGVMPQAFAFPAALQMWTPLRRGARSSTADAPSLLVFGRLAPGVSRDEAQAELTTVGQRKAADAPDTHAFLRPEVVPYAHLIFDPRDFGIVLALANIFLIVLIVVISADVALLMFARAASREVEIGVRSALGASRSRIVGQLFVEAVALASVSVIVGLAGARYALGSLLRTLEADSGAALPFWMNNSLTPSTIAYGVVLTMVIGVIIGVFPALKITAGGLSSRLRRLSAGGGGYRFGGVWTAVIAAQVAVTVLFPAVAFFFHRGVVSGQTRDVGFPAGEYLFARLALDAGLGRVPATIEELRRQLLAEPGVTGVTVADRLPGMQHSGGRFAVDGDDAPPTYGYDVRIASVDAEFFSTLGAPVMSGRAFTPADFASGREVAIVNASFVERVLRGGNPVGRRIRPVPRDGDQRPEPWIEIVGVVRDLGISGTDGVGLYRPLTPARSTVHMALHVGGEPTSFAGRLRTLASSVEPTLRVYDVMPLNRVGADQWLESQYLSRLLTVLSGVALLLSLMAIYAVLSFTVVQRTREIGTRVALGADRWRVIAAIVRRPLMQIGLGIGTGGALVVLAFVGMKESAPNVIEASVIALYATAMLGVCLSACIVPIRRAISLEPSQVLRADG